MRAVFQNLSVFRRFYYTVGNIIICMSILRLQAYKIRWTYTLMTFPLITYDWCEYIWQEIIYYICYYMFYNHVNVKLQAASIYVMSKYQ